MVTGITVKKKSLETFQQSNEHGQQHTSDFQKSLAYDQGVETSAAHRNPVE